VRRTTAGGRRGNQKRRRASSVDESARGARWAQGFEIPRVRKENELGAVRITAVSVHQRPLAVEKRPTGATRVRHLSSFHRDLNGGPAIERGDEVPGIVSAILRDEPADERYSRHIGRDIQGRLE
jgi:hypothetical protein